MPWSMNTDNAHPFLRMFWLRLPALNLHTRRKEFLELLQNKRLDLGHPESFKLFMRILLEELGYDPAYLAPELGIGVPTLYRYADGESIPHTLIRRTVLAAYTEYVRKHQ